MYYLSGSLSTADAPLPQKKSICLPSIPPPSHSALKAIPTFAMTRRSMRPPSYGSPIRTSHALTTSTSTSRRRPTPRSRPTQPTPPTSSYPSALAATPSTRWSETPIRRQRRHKAPWDSPLCERLSIRPATRVLHGVIDVNDRNIKERL